MSQLMRSTATYRVVDGHEILVDIHRPEGRAACPVLVYLHGGALIGGSRELKPDNLPFRRLLEIAARQGCAVAAFDYRLAPETKLPAVVSDIEAAFAWLVGAGARDFGLDPTRMMAAGDSAGGYLALLSGYRVSPRPLALISFYGYGTLTSDWYVLPNPYPAYRRPMIAEADIAAFRNGSVVSDADRRSSSREEAWAYYLWCRQTGAWPREVSGFREAELCDALAPFEPAGNVAGDYPPVLLIHGAMDTDVPLWESENMARVLSAQGVPHILQVIGNAEHGLAGAVPSDIERAFAVAEAFIVRHLA